MDVFLETEVGEVEALGEEGRAPAHATAPPTASAEGGREL